MDAGECEGVLSGCEKPGWAAAAAAAARVSRREVRASIAGLFRRVRTSLRAQ